MTAKEYLQQAYRLNEVIAKKQQEYDRIGSVATNTAPNVTGMPRSGGKNDKVCECAVNRANLSGEIDICIDMLIRCKKCIAYSIREVSNKQYRKLLVLRYIRFKSWEDIAKAMKKSQNHVQNRMHDKAIAKIKTQYIVLPIDFTH